MISCFFTVNTRSCNVNCYYWIFSLMFCCCWWWLLIGIYSSLTSRLMILIASREGVDMGVVKQRLLTIAPWESLQTERKVDGYQLNVSFRLTVSSWSVNYCVPCCECEDVRRGWTRVVLEGTPTRASCEDPHWPTWGSHMEGPQTGTSSSTF